MFHEVITDRAVQASASAGVILAVCAMLAADRFPAAFAILGAVWAGLTVAALVRAARTVR